jgi:DNA-binding transcriptional MerR regulator
MAVNQKSNTTKKCGTALVANATQTERQQMNLMTTQQAADLIYSTRGALRYWVKKGMLKKYPSPDGYSRRYLIDFDEVEKLFSQDWKERARENLPDNLISRKEAAQLLWINERSIGYYVRRGHLKKHYAFGNDYNYLLDRDEVLAQPQLYPERMEARKPRLREAAIKQNQARNENGKFIKKQQI